MNAEGVKTVGKFYGTATINRRGQLVIPANARKELGIVAGTKLLTFECLRGGGLVLVKGDTIEQMLGLTSQRSGYLE